MTKSRARIERGKLKVLRSKCLNLLSEGRMYAYHPERPGENPIAEYNHAMDALRYLVSRISRGFIASFLGKHRSGQPTEPGDCHPLPGPRASPPRRLGPRDRRCAEQPPPRPVELKTPDWSRNVQSNHLWRLAAVVLLGVLIADRLLRDPVAAQDGPEPEPPPIQKWEYKVVRISFAGDTSGLEKTLNELGEQSYEMMSATPATRYDKQRFDAGFVILQRPKR